jgi:hypothetical protein
LIGIDYCGPFKITPRGNQYVLVITDYFSRYVSATALPNCTADTTAITLFNEYICRYGIPGTIISDQGVHFKNQLMTNIRRLIGFNHIHSTVYHPQTNGVVERFNATFVPQISKLQDTENNNWDEYLPAVVFAYNSGVHRTTAYSPYQLLYGRPPRLPIYPPPSTFSFPKPNDYFQQLQKTLKLYHQQAHRNTLHHQQLAKIRYNANRLDPHYRLGDQVLTRVHGMRTNWLKAGRKAQENQAILASLLPFHGSNNRQEQPIFVHSRQSELTLRVVIIKIQSVHLFTIDTECDRPTRQCPSSTPALLQIQIIIL